MADDLNSSPGRDADKKGGEKMLTTVARTIARLKQAEKEASAKKQRGKDA